LSVKSDARSSLAAIEAAAKHADACAKAEGSENKLERDADLRHHALRTATKKMPAKSAAGIFLIFMFNERRLS
jgi:hypothetical protein